MPYLYSLLNRRRALEVLCRTLVSTIVSDKGLADYIVTELQRAADARQGPDPSRREQLQRRVAILRDHIQFVLDAPGDDRPRSDGEHGSTVGAAHGASGRATRTR